MSKPSFDKLVKDFYRRYQDKISVMGTMPGMLEAFVEEFVSTASAHYSEREIFNFLRSQGVPISEDKLKVERARKAKEKSQRVDLGDGTYMLNGVRFGEVRTPGYVEKLGDKLKRNEGE